MSKSVATAGDPWDCHSKPDATSVHLDMHSPTSYALTTIPHLLYLTDTAGFPRPGQVSELADDADQVTLEFGMSVE